MASNPEPMIDPTYIRTAAAPMPDPSAEATLIDGPGGLPPALRAMVESELAAVNEDTRIGELVPASIAIRIEPHAVPVAAEPRKPAVLMTAHMPSDLAFDELLDEDAAAEIALPKLPDHAIVSVIEPRTVHEYVEPARPAPVSASPTPNNRYRAVTPMGGAESDKFLVRPVSLSAPPPSDPLGLSAIAGVFEPLPFIDEDVTKTLFINRQGGDTSWEQSVDSYDTKLPGFTSPAPRGAAVARGVGPQRYIRTSIGKHPLPKVGESVDGEDIVFDAAPRPSPFLVAVLGFACVAAMFTTML